MQKDFWQRGYETVMQPSANNEFIVESREHLQSLENSLLELERTDQPSVVSSLIHEAFRVVHSLKGNAGFFGLTGIRELAHAAESVLEGYRWEPSLLDPLALQSLFSANDRLRAMVDSIDSPCEFDNSSLIAQLHLFVKLPSLSAIVAKKQYRVTVAKNDSVVELIQFLYQQDSTCVIQPAVAIDLARPIEIQPVLLKMAFDSKLSPLELHTKLSQFAKVDLESLGWIDISQATSVLPYFDSSDGSVVVRNLHYSQVNLGEGLPAAPVLLSIAPSQHSSQRHRVSDDTASAHPSGAPIDSPVIAAAHPSATIGSEISDQFRPTDPPTTATNTHQIIHEHSLTPQSPSSSQTQSVKPASDPQQLSASSMHGSAILSNAGPPSNAGGSDKPTSIRIPVELLDRLMNLVGELTIVRNQSQATLGSGEEAARAVAQRLNSVTSELQDAVLKTRMQPVSNLFGRFPRMVRDLARQLGKQVEIQFHGHEVELDKSVLEQLSDPLTHLIRNSIDHGIESLDVRAAKGKPAVGRIVVTARAGDGQVHIEIKDDGRGLDPAAIRAKTLALGLKTEAELQKLSPKELAMFILLPGFSTAAKVTDVSGRGVGMDVVKTNIERLEGSLSVDSEFGIGTTILLRVPLTLAIIPCEIVHVGCERIAIPQRAIEEIVCIYPGGNAAIESTHNAEYLRLRESLVSVARMNEVMARLKPFDEATRAEIVATYAYQRQKTESTIQYVLILNASGRRCGLLVDDVKGTEEVVVKPMHPSLRQVTIFSGATVMGDGRVALIANAEGIVSHAGCSLPKEVPLVNSFRDPAEVHRVLLFEYGPDERFALPLIQIRRVEAMRRENIDYVGKQRFVSIGGVSTRLVFLSELLSVSGCELGEEFHVIMPKFVVEPMGIVASRIVDTESMSIDLQEASVVDPGILGTALIQDRLCVFLDIQYLRDKTFTSHLGETLQKKRMLALEQEKGEVEQIGSQEIAAHVLLVDDTPFFREIVRRYLESQGMTIVTAVDGIDGLKKFAAEKFDLIVSDIEMPNMDGWDFCTEIRKQGYDGPMIALTSLSKREHERQAQDCGFDTFEEKLDHDSLIKTVRRTIRSRSSLGIDSARGVRQ